MRDFKGMKRQRGRNRSGGGTNSGGGKPQQNANRAFDSTGPENIKVRGHAQHVFEKYQQLARDATSSGDRVLAENFLQHAEHYFRVLRTLQPNRPVSDFVARDTYGSNYDIDFEDESGAQADPEPETSTETQTEEARSPERQDYRDQPRDQTQNRERDQNRDRGNDRRPDQQRNRYEGRDDRNRDNRNRDDNQGDFRREDRAPRTDVSETTETREERPAQRDTRPERSENQRSEYRRERTYEPREPRSDPMAVIEPKATPLTSTPVAAPEPETDSAKVLRSQDGGVSHAPAFLQAPALQPSAPALTAGEDAPVRRPRGRPRKQPLADATPANEDA